MPRYRDDDYQDSRGVHRRRLERRGSNTPIIVGAIVIGVALVGVVLASMIIGGKDDPEVMKEQARTGTVRFLEAAFSGDADGIFKQIDVEGAEGWVLQRLGKERSKKYRHWDTWKDPEEAKAWRIEQDQRILSEIRGLPKKLALDDLASIQRVVKDAPVHFEMNTAKIAIQNRNGLAFIYLQKEGDRWVTVYWELKHNASGR